MNKELALRIMKALSHSMNCPFTGCRCDAAEAARNLYAEAAKMVRDSR